MWRRILIELSYFLLTVLERRRKARPVQVDRREKAVRPGEAQDGPSDP